MMKRLLYLCFVLAFFLVSCDKGGDVEAPVISGEVTLSSKLIFDSGAQSYDKEGFSFSDAKKVSILSDAENYITVGCSGNTVDIQVFGNYHESFSLYGSYSDATEAEAAFYELTEVSVSNWEEWANPVRMNQIWIFRTKDKKYVKFWVRKLMMSDDDNVDCTIKWVFQHDGTASFPAI